MRLTGVPPVAQSPCLGPWALRVERWEGPEGGRFGQKTPRLQGVGGRHPRSPAWHPGGADPRYQKRCRPLVHSDPEMNTIRIFIPILYSLVPITGTGLLFETVL